ncbi:MAG: MarR family transcriptional regulator [Bacteroidetes bacterium]|nr:MarR family transcriptional regulator [Bacteroidota bacterium]
MRIEDEIKQKKFKSEHQKMYINLVYTANWMSTQQMRMFKEFGLSVQQYNILRILRGQVPNAVNLGLIQDRMLDKNSNASRLIEKLKIKKLVERKESKIDRRQVDIMITEKGLDLLKKMDGKVEEAELINSNLTKQEAETLSDLLDKLRG